MGNAKFVAEITHKHTEIHMDDNLEWLSTTLECLLITMSTVTFFVSIIAFVFRIVEYRSGDVGLIPTKPPFPYKVEWTFENTSHHKRILSTGDWNHNDFPVPVRFGFSRKKSWFRFRFRYQDEKRKFLRFRFYQQTFSMNLMLSLWSANKTTVVDTTIIFK